ncbi:MAG: phosphoribosylpyrophosphate synthetase [Salegentibacter sp.]
MNKRRTYDTVSEAINDLSRRGYTTNFSILKDRDRLICGQTSIELTPEEFEIDEIYRFEGNTDPGDEMIVFAIASNQHDLKGVLVNAFGMYSDSNTSKITKRLTQHL